MGRKVLEVSCKSQVQWGTKKPQNKTETTLGILNRGNLIRGIDSTGEERAEKPYSKWEGSLARA